MSPKYECYKLISGYVVKNTNIYNYIYINIENYICLIRCYILRSKNYMFRPTVAIIRFLLFESFKFILYNSRDGVLIRRSQHQNVCWSIVLLYWVCGRIT